MVFFSRQGGGAREGGREADCDCENERRREGEGDSQKKPTGAQNPSALSSDSHLHFPSGQNSMAIVKIARISLPDLQLPPKGSS